MSKGEYLEDKTIFTIEHARKFFQTFAEIEAEIHAPNIEVTAKVRTKEVNTND